MGKWDEFVYWAFLGICGGGVVTLVQILNGIKIEFRKVNDAAKNHEQKTALLAELLSFVEKTAAKNEMRLMKLEERTGEYRHRKTRVD